MSFSQCCREKLIQNGLLVIYYCQMSIAAINNPGLKIYTSALFIVLEILFYRFLPILLRTLKFYKPLYYFLKNKDRFLVLVFSFLLHQQSRRQGLHKRPFLLQ